MTSAFEIIPATAEDLPTLAHIAVIAMDVDLLHRVMFPSTDPLNTTFRESIILNQMRSTFAKPEAHGFKAVSKASGQIIGYGLFSFENPEKEGEKAKAPPHKLPEGINQEFMKRVGGFVRSEHAKYLADKRHVCMFGSTFLYVVGYSNSNRNRVESYHGIARSPDARHRQRSFQIRVLRCRGR